MIHGAAATIYFAAAQNYNLLLKKICMPCAGLAIRAVDLNKPVRIGVALGPLGIEVDVLNIGIMSTNLDI